MHLNLEFLAIFGCKMVVLVDQKVHVHFRVSLCVDILTLPLYKPQCVMTSHLKFIEHIPCQTNFSGNIFLKNKMAAIAISLWKNLFFSTYVPCSPQKNVQSFYNWFVTQLCMSSFCMWTFDLEGPHSKSSINHSNSLCIQLC